MENLLHLIFLGAPGTGKGTQAKILTNSINITQISTGDILRAEMKANTPLGIRAKEYIDKGHLVPDDLMIDMIRNKISSPDFPVSWIMDGFPRTLPQAVEFDKLLKEFKLPVTMVVDFQVPMDVLIDRLTSRRICSGCGISYNTITNPSSKGDICEKCEGKLYQRTDDSLDSVKERMVVYEKQTAPLIEYYKKQNLYKEVDGTQEIQKIQKDLIALIS